MPQYLSTDPNAGAEKQYLSTDPNAGTDAPKPKTRADITDDMRGSEVARILTGERGPLGQLAQGAESGALTGGALTKAVAEPARKVIHGLARTIMEKALGSQSPVNKRFPGVDLAEEALKHGTNPTKVAAAGRTAAKEVVDAGRASTAAPVKPREIIAGLRPVYDRAAQAERGGIAGAREPVRSTIREIRKTMPKAGASIEDSLVAKSEWQARGKAAQRALPGELKGADARTANAVGKQFASVIRSRGDQRVNSALDNSQSLMALQQAVQTMANRPSLLQLVAGAGLGGTTGAMTGDWGKAATAFAAPLAFSPKGLSVMAKGVHAAEPAAAPLLEAVYRSLLAAGNSGGTSTR